jgi:hypothetical protein
LRLEPRFDCVEVDEFATAATVADPLPVDLGLDTDDDLLPGGGECAAEEPEECCAPDVRRS